jgi:hypothetical protein
MTSPEYFCGVCGYSGPLSNFIVNHEDKSVICPECFSTNMISLVDDPTSETLRNMKAVVLPQPNDDIPDTEPQTPKSKSGKRPAIKIDDDKDE